jgi:two-component system, chemotaxis family, sensor kinase CheA
MNTSNILEIFFTECDELLQDMESKLLDWDTTDDKEELIDAVFRSVHTIKGSAGIFAYDRIVAFTHVAESVLDEVRENKL